MRALPIAAAVLMLATSTAAPALAKPGDLYVNADGSCDKGDSKPKGSYWCVESIKTAGNGGPVAVGPKPGRIYPQAGPAVNRPASPKPKSQ